ncbi:hypothetical protein [Senimuribacter intestinalis]|uniref:hypothetical protein n=1 Tax=Senimuribacter intestinalis TaxID=2941507 RepID=UPI0020401D86|nr:hypothetical protein [Senimuribacter intestinalis]
MDAMITAIENAIHEKYEEIKKESGVLTSIDEIHRQIRFRNPDLAEHIKKRFLELAKQNGDLL